MFRFTSDLKKKKIHSDHQIKKTVSPVYGTTLESSAVCPEQHSRQKSLTQVLNSRWDGKYLRITVIVAMLAASGQIGLAANCTLSVKCQASKAAVPSLLAP